MEKYGKKIGKERMYVRTLVRHAIALFLMMFMSGAYAAPKTILVLGDSLSAEYGLIRGSGWVPLLQKKLEQEKIPATLINASISGDTTTGGKNRLASLLKKHHPDIVIVELGANDALRGLQLNATRTNLQDIIAQSQQAKAKVLLIGMQIPPNYGKDYTQRFIQLFPALAKQTKSALAPFLMEGIADDMTLFQSDRIHPNEQAQPAMLNNVWPHLKPLL